KPVAMGFDSLRESFMKCAAKMKASKAQRDLCCDARVQSTAEVGASERRFSAREDGLHPGRCS
ncbi:MAG TPA: hypothetical protein PKE49_15965, partial [Leptospiraceae bacterium]|nr:hypothetical protein [Leptospiraceae bacterium]